MKTPSSKLLFFMTLLLATQVHGEEPPRKLETLTTGKGRTYEKVQIREITPAGIKIAHESGSATIPFEDLPSALQKQLGGFDRKAAEEHRKEVEAKIRSQEAEIERGLREQEKAAKQQLTPPKPAPAPASADEEGTAKGESEADAENPWDASLDPPAPAPEEASAPAPVPEEPVLPKVVEKGVLSSKIVGYRSGVKRVQFRVRTNCKAKLQVFRVIPDHHSIYPHSHTYEVEPGRDYVEEVWVYNDYSADLTSVGGKPLDSESHDRKTNLGGGLGGTGLR